VTAAFDSRPSDLLPLVADPGSRHPFTFTHDTVRHIGRTWGVSWSEGPMCPGGSLLPSAGSPLAAWALRRPRPGPSWVVVVTRTWYTSRRTSAW